MTNTQSDTCATALHELAGRELAVARGLRDQAAELLKLAGALEAGALEAGAGLATYRAGQALAATPATTEGE